MSVSNAPSTTFTSGLSAGEELEALGWEINANQYRVVHLAARFEEELDWFRLGHKSASSWIAAQLEIQTSTAREWIRVGHALRQLPLIDSAFAAQEISYAKVRILTRWADDDNEARLLELARTRTAGRLTVAVAKMLSDDGETDAERDVRLHDERSFTTWTDGDGMAVLRIVLAPSVAKPVVAAVDELVRRIAETPIDGEAAAAEGTDETESDLSADASGQPSVAASSPIVASAALDGADGCGSDLSADAFGEPSVVAQSPIVAAVRTETTPDSLRATLCDLRRRWHPDARDDWYFPSLCQQRADAFVALFLGCDVTLTTEVVLHVRSDGITFDDGTPTTNNAVVRQLDDAFVRLLVHDAQRRPINASSRRRHPTTRQQRVVMEAHGHECVDCQSTDLLELDHNPSYQQTRRTVTHELEPRCARCHRARHRLDSRAA